jgi:hypothetical protein
MFDLKIFVEFPLLYFTDILSWRDMGSTACPVNFFKLEYSEQR